MNKKDVKFLLPFAAMLLFSDSNAMKLKWVGALTETSNANQIVEKIKPALKGGNRISYKTSLAIVLGKLYNQSEKKDLSAVMKAIIPDGTFNNTGLAAVIKDRKDTLQLLLDIANAGLTKVDNWKTLIESEGKSSETDEFWKAFAAKYTGADKANLDAALNAQNEDKKNRAQQKINDFKQREFAALKGKVNTYNGTDKKPTKAQQKEILGEIDRLIGSFAEFQGIDGVANCVTQLQTLRGEFVGFGIKDEQQDPNPGGNGGQQAQIDPALQAKLNEGVELFNEKELKNGDLYGDETAIDGKEYIGIRRGSDLYFALKEGLNLANGKYSDFVEVFKQD